MLSAFSRTSLRLTYSSSLSSEQSASAGKPPRVIMQRQHKILLKVSTQVETKFQRKLKICLKENESCWNAAFPYRGSFPIFTKRINSIATIALTRSIGPSATSVEYPVSMAVSLLSPVSTRILYHCCILYQELHLEVEVCLRWQ